MFSKINHVAIVSENYAQLAQFYIAAFGMNVMVWGREGSLERARADGFAAAASREAFYEQSDVISLHIRLRPETRGIVTAADLTRMKPSALFVNTARADLIEPDALVEALKRGRPGFAAVDVYEHEPVLNGEHPLLKLDNALCTPHSAWIEPGTYELYFGEAFDNLLAFVAGLRIVPTSRDHNATRIDGLGAVLSIFGIGTLVYAIIEAPAHGWMSMPTMTAFAIAIVGYALLEATFRRRLTNVLLAATVLLAVLAVIILAIRFASELVIFGVILLAVIVLIDNMRELRGR